MMHQTKPKTPISCDTVAWLLASLRRLSEIQAKNYPSISRIKELAVYATLYEVMELLWLDFANDDARLNATPQQVRKVENEPTGKCFAVYWRNAIQGYWCSLYDKEVDPFDDCIKCEERSG